MAEISILISFQFNIVNDKLYEVLGLVFEEYMELFNGTDVFHMGGDEVNMNCYNSSQEIRDYLERENKVGTEDDILELWRSFQRKAFRLVAEANHGERMPAILWTNTMTEKGAEKFLTKDDYIIQIWTTGQDHSIADVINKEFKTIFSNYDAWYLDCGYAGWVTNGTNWCSPYKGKCWTLAASWRLSVTYLQLTRYALALLMFKGFDSRFFCNVIL